MVKCLLHIHVQAVPELCVVSIIAITHTCNQYFAVGLAFWGASSSSSFERENERSRQ